MPLEIPCPHDRAFGEHSSRWRDHVTAGRIGTGTRTTTAILLNHLRNEEVLLGKARSFSFPTPIPYRGR